MQTARTLALQGGEHVRKKHKRRMKVKWALGWASRQMTNRYEFRPLSEFFTESVPATVLRVIGIKKEQNMLDKALDRLRGLTFAPVIDAGLVPPFTT